MKIPTTQTSRQMNTSQAAARIKSIDIGDKS